MFSHQRIVDHAYTNIHEQKNNQGV